ncbi:thioredoxin family protein [Dechloromonas sp. H13]|uniref:thioredoxin family protein n=1 Tax=Dechloromonas sp. H13 TaxID=2570193 RepID=UPI00129188BA|nr:thioredoxin family protein [Dechloromonas sp. H13]
MTYIPTYAVDAPERAEIDALPGSLLLEFGVDWCPHCQGAQPAIEAALRDYPDLRHVKVEDGPGRPLGRSFRVKLWPTLILLHDGREVARVVRPTDVSEVSEILSTIAAC